MRGRIATTFVVALLISGSVAACNAILGVQDVKLKQGADGGDDPGDEDSGDVPQDDSGGSITPDRPNVFQAALGDQHSCARKPAGTVRCWGDDSQGQTGSGSDFDGGVTATPVDVKGVADAVDIAAGLNHTCVARKGGTVSCWGYNLDGQLGNGESNNRHTTPVDVKNITNAIAVAAGGNFSCAVRGAGSVACWGGNGSGQLGTGDQSPSTTPVAVKDLTDATAISAGQAHACAVKSDGTVVCWGDGANGQLGGGNATPSPSPISVGSLPSAAVTVTAGERATCALTKDGSVYCWGANELGQLGNGAPNTTPNPSPIVVSNLSDATNIWTGGNHTCAVRKSGAVVCWGSGSLGQLGDGQDRTTNGVQASFVVVSGIQNAIGVGAGGNHSCVPTKTNAIICWGDNAHGQLGNGASGMGQRELSPVSVLSYP